MMHSCKYPKKLTGKGYYKKILKEYECFDLSELSKECFLSFLLQNVEYLIEKSEGSLEQILDSLLHVEALSQTECILIPDAEIQESAHHKFHDLLMVFRKPIWVVNLVENNYKSVKLDRGLDAQYISFLQKVTCRCIPEIVQANRVTLQRPSKTVRFTSPKKQEPPQAEVSQRREPMLDLGGNIAPEDTRSGSALK
jgi:hypothetical protein